MSVLSAEQNTQEVNVPHRLHKPDPISVLKAHEEELKYRVLHSPLLTPVNVERLKFLLHGYNPALTQYLVEGFSLGFISYVNKLRGLHDPTKSFLIQMLLTALSRREPVDKRLPVTRPVLHELVRAHSFTNSSAFQRSLFSLIFLVAFYGLFVIGKLTTKSNRFASSVVQFGNLTFLSRNSRMHVAKITISEYKHNTSRCPFDILITREVSSAFCPVLALIQYCELRGSSPGPLFCHADQSPILTHQFNVELQRCLAYCGLDTSRYKSHSFRIGGPPS